MTERSGRSWPWRRARPAAGASPAGGAPQHDVTQYEGTQYQNTPRQEAPYQRSSYERPSDDTSVFRDEPGGWWQPEPARQEYSASEQQPQPSQQYPQQPPYPHAYGSPGPAYRAPYAPSESSSPSGRSRTGLLIGAALLAGLVGGGLGAAAVVGLDDDAGTTTVATDQPVDELPAPSTAEPLPEDNASVVAVAEQTLPSVVQIKVAGGGGEGTGSGFVLDRDGHIVTNNHVVESAADSGQITVVLRDGSEREAEIVGRSPSYDIAVIEVDPEGLVAAPLGRSSDLRVGQTVVALGSPLGLSSTVTSGIVSALERPVTTGGSSDAGSYISAIQTDAAINPGNSGGPLVDLRGRVVGVNSAIAAVGATSGQSGSIGVGFAVPIDQVQLTAAQILEDGEARYPVIGASVAVSDADGAEVSEVIDNGPAQEAGLRAGDVVTSVDGDEVADGTELIVAIRKHQPGETVTLTFDRGGEERQVDVVLDSEVG
jgi:putative serine protease PepD